MYRHHIEPRVQFFVPREESFPIPMKYIDVTRATFSNLDVLQEKCIDDYWNVDGNGNLSNSCRNFTRFTLLNETPPRRYMWSGRRLTNIQTTSRPDHVWLEIEKPKLECARILRKFYFIDPRDEEYEDIIENARRNLETPMAGVMPCKRLCSRTSIRETFVLKTTRAIVLEVKKRFSCIDTCREGRNSVLYYNLQEVCSDDPSDDSA